MRRVTLVLLLGLAALLPAVAAAQESPAKCFANADRWTYQRDKETIAAAGERFFEDVRKCDPSFGAAVTEAVRYQIQAEESDKFVRSKTYVLLAYGVAWALLAASALAVWLRQRRLEAEIAALEAKVRAAEARGD